MISLSNNSSINSFSLVFYDKKFIEQASLLSIARNNRCYNIQVFNSDTSYTVNKIIYTDQKFNLFCCGIINKDSFNINMQSINISKKYNTCLAYKFAIDEYGNVRNCLSMPNAFGNIFSNNLSEILLSESFRRLWHINKDLISVCKDCEYRNICTDCRAYIEDPENIYSKPIKCGYNPYTGEWSDWSINPLKQKAIDFFGMREMVGGH